MKQIERSKEKEREEKKIGGHELAYKFDNINLIQELLRPTTTNVLSFLIFRAPSSTSLPFYFPISSPSSPRYQSLRPPTSHSPTKIKTHWDAGFSDTIFSSLEPKPGIKRRSKTSLTAWVRHNRPLRFLNIYREGCGRGRPGGGREEKG